MCYTSLLFFFFFNDTATTEIYPLSLHDALPILRVQASFHARSTRAVDPSDLAGFFSPLMTAWFSRREPGRGPADNGRLPARPPGMAADAGPQPCAAHTQWPEIGRAHV